MFLFSTCCSVCQLRTRKEDEFSDKPSEPAAVALPGDSRTLQGADAAAHAAEASKQSLLPFVRQSSRRFERQKSRTGSSVIIADGGTGGDPGAQGVVSRSPVDLLFRHYSNSELGDCTRSIAQGEGASSVSTSLADLKRRNSQLEFSDTSQTVIVFDWDDTLFPTSYINDDLGLHWRLPLNKQRNLKGSERDEFVAKLRVCEDKALATLRIGRQCGHVVVVTLATSGWVELACQNFYTNVGALLEELSIPVIYAQEKSNTVQQEYDKAKFESHEEIEKFWGLVKGKAISEEVSRFYSQYEGQSWKNILSVGDSIFERYGLLAATSAYMRGDRLDRLDEEDADPPFTPTQQDAWLRVAEDGRVKKLRAKCCKLVDQPDMDELIVQLGMVGKWLQPMVQLDEGFDLDLECLEDENQLEIIEGVLRGEIPASQMPR